jgi:hypothetical protein
MQYAAEAPEGVQHMPEGLESMRSVLEVIEDIRHVPEMPGLCGMCSEAPDVIQHALVAVEGLQCVCQECWRSCFTCWKRRED